MELAITIHLGALEWYYKSKMAPDFYHWIDGNPMLFLFAFKRIERVGLKYGK